MEVDWRGLGVVGACLVESWLGPLGFEARNQAMGFGLLIRKTSARRFCIGYTTDVGCTHTQMRQKVLLVFEPVFDFDPEMPDFARDVSEAT